MTLENHTGPTVVQYTPPVTTVTYDDPFVVAHSGIVQDSIEWDLPQDQPQTVRTVVVPPDTPLYCYCCHDIEAPEYRLRRSSGKYITLCYRHGEGCWERSARPMCSFKDHQGVQCDQVAEFEISYGRDMLVKVNRCLVHVAPALKDDGEHRIFAL
jgi:hypothetical protein